MLVVDGAYNSYDTETYHVPPPTGAPGWQPDPTTRAGGIGATYEAATNHLCWHEVAAPGRACRASQTAARRAPAYRMPQFRPIP
ncbi:hypothetical protein GCM10010276_38730 [Streptomyces longisporus]|uniref:Uncharacterized protein n=1 Tax=Streptomyces longisporus TaxID=1948 RepID=A0ABP5ZE25_STRLO